MQIRQKVCRTDSIWFLSANARRVAIPCRGRCSTEGFETPLDLTATQPRCVEGVRMWSLLASTSDR